LAQRRSATVAELGVLVIWEAASPASDLLSVQFRSAALAEFGALAILVSACLTGHGVLGLCDPRAYLTDQNDQKSDHDSPNPK
jgi:hypothetical protein